jgi:predicted porin
MKKSLVALAVLAASGASFAQVTVTGTLSMGYQAYSLPSGAQSAGLGIDTSEVYFNAAEDLGGGQKIAAKLGIVDANRKPGMNGGDASLTYTNNSFGQIKLATEKIGTYFAAVAELGLPFVGMDGKVQDTLSSSDSISYTVPVGPVYVSLMHAEHDKGIGIGAGSTGASSLYSLYQNINEIDVYYAAGALKLLGVLRQYDNRQESAAMIGALPAKMYPVKKDLTNLQASYDLGMMKVGAGYQQVTTVAGAKQTDVELTAALPMGSWTVGLLVAKSTTSDADSKIPTGPTTVWDTALYNGTANVFGLTVDYAFSKRTSLTMKYATWTPSGYIQYGTDLAAAALVGPGNGKGGLNWGQNASSTALLLTHSF